MTGRRWLLLTAALAACALLVLLVRARDPRADSPSRAGPPARDQLRDLAPEEPEAGPARAEPAVLRGRVFGLSDAPIAKAEVSVLVPRTHDLVRTGDDGAYELRFARAGQYLVEAALTSEYAPSRAWVEVAEQGDPEPRDFRLEPAGTLFGEVTMGGVPVRDGGVELFAQGAGGAEESVRDTTVRDGYFSFPSAPPAGVTLRVDATSDEGFLPEPRFVTYRDAPVNVGRLELVRYPELRFRMRLPNGRVAEDVRILSRDQFGVDPDTRRAYVMLWPEEHSRAVVRERHDVTCHVLFGGLDSRGNEDVDRNTCTLYLAERDVHFAVGRTRDLEIVVRPGPIPVTSRLVDERDRPQRGRIALGADEVSTGADGSFSVLAPHGGLVPVWLLAWDVPGLGVIPLDPRWTEHALLLDVDEPAKCRIGLDCRVVCVGIAPSIVELLADPPLPGNDNRRWTRWNAAEPRGVAVAWLSPKLRPGEYRWKRATTWGGAVIAEGSITVKAEGAVVLDLR